MTNINFHPRDLTQKASQRIWAIFYIDTKRVKIDTNQSIYPKDWSKDKQRSLSSHKNYDKLNKLLKEQSEFISDYIENLKSKKKRFYKDELQEAFNLHFRIGENKPKEEGDVVDFISFIDKYILNRKDLTEGTHQTLRGARKNIIIANNLVSPKLLSQWKKMSLKEKRLNPDFLQPTKQLDFDSIDKKWMENYNTWLLNATYIEKRDGIEVSIPYSKNYIAKELKIVKQFANSAAAEGLINNLSYRSVKAQWEEADTIALNWNEIYNLKALDLDPNSTEGKVRNLFVFNCYCGLRYSDLNRLGDSRFNKLDEQIFIKLRMKKTDDIVNYPVLASAVEIIKTYDYKLPKVCKPIFNEVIKKVSFKAGIIGMESKRETRGGKKIILTIPRYKMVSSHTGRRSFATNFEAMGVPINELMAITGHTTEKAFRKYVRKKVESNFKGFLAAGANR